MMPISMYGNSNMNIKKTSPKMAECARVNTNNTSMKGSPSVPSISQVNIPGMPKGSSQVKTSGGK